MSVVVVTDLAGATEHLSAWEALAASALEANAFFEPWLLLPALQVYRARVRLIFVYATAANGVRTLIGFCPVERCRTYRGWPVPCQRVWLHPHAYLGTPLLHADHARLALTALLDWAAAESGLLDLPLVAADGPFAKLLTEVHAAPRLLTNRQERGMLYPAGTADAYLHTNLSGSTRRALQRRQRRLAECGRLTVEATLDHAGVTGWTEEFLRLEASGWKGRAGTALATSGPDTVFFRMATHNAAAAGRLMRLTLRLDGRALASRCAFRAGAGAFSFKSAFDEAFAAHSPGVLLEFENIRHCHAVAGLDWMDSCTSPANDVINRLWHHRRALETVTLATSRRSSDLLVRLLGWLQAQRRRRRTTATNAPHPSAVQEALPCIS